MGAQNANGEIAASFLSNKEFFAERSIGGQPFAQRDVRNLTDLLYLLRWENFWNPTETVTTKGGLSGLFGPNASGPSGYRRVSKPQRLAERPCHVSECETARPSGTSHVHNSPAE